MKGPNGEELSSWRAVAVGGALTGPTRSGMKMTNSATLTKMKKNPIRVTMFGASHNGKSSTKAFHCIKS